MENNPFTAADRLAPHPATEQASTVEVWARHYAAQAVAANAYLRRVLHEKFTGDGEVPDVGFIVGTATASTAVALALTTPRDEIGAELWSVSPELGALNGEWEDTMDDLLDRLGINPADIDPDLEPGDFTSPSVRAEAANRA